MNVLVLTPDRVGSTLLQRLITVYANINENYNPHTINLHELTNGVLPYENTHFNQTLLGKPAQSGSTTWGYFQSLGAITDLLQNRTHDVVGRVAHYHIKNRRDSQPDQLEFYEYLNQNFFIISARRQNVFEHALSWSIYSESKKLNVFNAQQKFEAFGKIHRDGMQVAEDVFESHLRRYDQYLDWVDAHFNVNSYFDYERDLPNIEKYILGLNVFRSGQRPLNWQDRFGIEFADWNRMHYLMSLVPFDHEFTAEEQDFMTRNNQLYHQCQNFVQCLVNEGTMTTGIPIKLHTLKQKAEIVTNVDQCLLAYNRWVHNTQPTYALPYQPEALTQAALLEHQTWSTAPLGNVQLLK
jgi:hypothetical protein